MQRCRDKRSRNAVAHHIADQHPGLRLRQLEHVEQVAAEVSRRLKSTGKTKRFGITLTLARKRHARSWEICFLDATGQVQLRLNRLISFFQLGGVMAQLCTQRIALDSVADRTGEDATVDLGFD